MLNATPPTFQQAVKKNLKRMAIYWAPLSVIFAGLGTLLGFYTLSTYATAIGRPDLMAAALEAKSALIPWLAAVAGMLGVYLFILLSTTFLFGLTMSLFSDAASQQRKLVGILFVPVLSGILAMLWHSFKGPSLSGDDTLLYTLVGLAATLFGLVALPGFRVAVDICATFASTAKPRSWPVRGLFILMLALLLIATVFSAVFPASLIYSAYADKDTLDGMNRLMFISMFATTVPLLPVVVFYVCKGDLFKRLFFSLLAVVACAAMVIVVAPGSSASIVYSAALAMKARDPVEARFWLTKTWATEDFDTQIWGEVEELRGHPVVRAFPLFSFGDVLLLCPTRLINKTLKEWPEHSDYCVLTQSSNAIRTPRKSAPAIDTATPSGNKTGQASPEHSSDASPH
ncbi:hypothetical protein [Pseudomonas sp. Irchel 3H9]|uniref:hypothetical protein n=1 Tax=Pseudomonas sp. Irchel 3H9 TaxID=2009043 RepID=UPI000BA4C93D|nr:hypothetical protein [Pseudomonas sp. Irchel 3H9]